VKSISEKSRADYFKKRREEKGQFYVEVDKDKLIKLSEKLNSQEKTKTTWLNEKIDEEISEK